MALNITLNALPNASSPIYDGGYLTGSRPAMRTFRHGDAFTITGNYGNMSSVRTFLGGVWESTAIDATPANITNWTFDNTAGAPVVIKEDGTRGKVLYGNNSNNNLNSAIRYQIPGGVSENRRMFTTHVTKGNLRLNGLKYNLNHQTKHFRFNPTNSVTDYNPDLKWHRWEDSSSLLISTATGIGNVDYSTFPPKNDNKWYRMELFFNPGTQGNIDGTIVARIHHNGQTIIVHNDQTFGAYGDASRHTSYVEQYYYGNFNGHVRIGEFTVGTIANNYTYRINTTGYAAQYISSSLATELEILNGIRDAVLNNTNQSHTAYVSGNKVIVAPIDPNDIYSAFSFNNGGSTNSVITNPYYEGPKPTTLETWRDDHCLQAGNSSVDGWERIELRTAVDETNSLHREQQILTSWTIGGGISGTINTGGLPKGRHELYLCAITDVNAAGKDVVVYSELVAVVVN